LLNELRESLQQQTATADVLKVISSSPGELERVFNAMLANATRICEATFGHLWLFEGSVFRAVAVHGTQGFVDHMRHHPMSICKRVQEFLWIVSREPESLFILPISAPMTPNSESYSPNRCPRRNLGRANFCFGA